MRDARVSLAASPSDGAADLPTAILFAAIPGKAAHHAPSLVSLRDGRLIAAWYSYAGPNELDDPSIYFASRGADAKAWSPPIPLLESRALGKVANPVLHIDDDDNLTLFFARVVTGWDTAHIERVRLGLTGELLGRPVRLGPLFGHNVRNRPRRLRDGRWLLPAYDELSGRPVFYRSVRGTDEWEIAAVVAAGARPGIQPALVVRHDGTVGALLRPLAGNRAWWLAGSVDGACWSTPAISAMPNPGSAVDIVVLDSGAWLVAFNNHEQRHALSVALSDDEGGIWRSPRLVARADERAFYPSLTQTSDGRIHLLFSGDRQSIRYVTFTEAWVRGAHEP